VNVEQKLWILDDVHPETQQQAATTRANDQSTETLQTKPLYCFAVICGQNTISMLWGNTAYCVKSTSEDLSRYANKIELVGLRNIRIITILLRNVIIRHTASTSMYLRTFCVRVMSPERHHWKPAVQAAAVMLRMPPVDGQSPASQPCPLVIYGAQF